jgi:hypothetical protein
LQQANPPAVRFLYAVRIKLSDKYKFIKKVEFTIL